MSRLGDLVAAVGLLLVIEGLICFAAPAFSRRAVEFFLTLSTSHIQRIGLAAMLTGLAVLWGMGWF